jgi:hypothetical protein
MSGGVDVSDERGIDLPVPLPFDRPIPTAGKGMRELEEALNAGARDGFRVSQILKDPVNPVVWMHASGERAEYACISNHVHERYTVERLEEEGFGIIGQVGAMFILERTVPPAAGGRGQEQT